jgi:hypothetical protein
MDIDQLKEQFLVGGEIQKERLTQLVHKALEHCVVHKNGTVELRHKHLAGKDQVKLVLSARLLASKLDESFSGEVTVEDIAESTGLPKNQVAARAKECTDERFAERGTRGSYRARVLKVEEFLDTLSTPKASRSAS